MNNKVNKRVDRIHDDEFDDILLSICKRVNNKDKMNDDDDNDEDQKLISDVLKKSDIDYKLQKNKIYNMDSKKIVKIMNDNEVNKCKSTNLVKKYKGEIYKGI